MSSELLSLHVQASASKDIRFLAVFDMGLDMVAGSFDDGRQTGEAMEAKRGEGAPPFHRCEKHATARCRCSVGVGVCQWRHGFAYCASELLAGANRRFTVIVNRRKA